MDATKPITIRASSETLSEIDAMAATMDRTRDDVVNQALRQYIETNSWQLERILQGQKAAREGRTLPAEDVFAAIADKHG